MRSTLNALSDHSRSRHSATVSRRLFIRDAEISVLVGFWSLILATPIIVWPVATWLWEHGCKDLDPLECVSSTKPRCLWKRDQLHPWGACASKGRGYMTMWGSMLMQFLFSVYVDLGSSVKFTCQGAFGTLLALANMEFLNTILGFWLRGGAFADQLQEPGKPVNSKWLPLCHDGFTRLADAGAHCFGNVWWNQLSLGGSLKFLFVLLDLVLYVVAVLHVGTDTNTRVFALSTHVYFLMAFLNPTTDDFHKFPTTPYNYSVMIFAACAIAILCFHIPKRRFTALGAAGGTAAHPEEGLCREVADSVAVLLSALHGTTGELMRQKTLAALEETEATLKDLDAALAAAWFEDFGQGPWARRRRRLRRFGGCLRHCVGHIPAIQQAAAALSPRDAELVERRVPSLQVACAAARDLVSAAAEDALRIDAGDGDAEDEARPPLLLELGRQLHARLEAVGSELGAARREPAASSAAAGDAAPPPSAQACAFLFTACAILADSLEAVSGAPWRTAARSDADRQRSYAQRALRILQTVRSHFGITLGGNYDVTHPRFVLRTTLSIVIAFSIGHRGIWNVLPAYSYYPASTIAVIVYTYTGSSTPIMLRRVSGVVLGKVIGTSLQLYLAVQHVLKALLYAVSMWVIVVVTFFLYLHGDKDIGYVSCLTAAYAASSMIPGNCMFRPDDTPSFQQVTPALIGTIISTVLGGLIVTVVDLLLGSSAVNHARQRLARTLKRAVALLNSMGTDAERQQREGFWEEVEALSEVVPFAAAEPAYWHAPFQAELYQDLLRRLREIGSHIATISWAMKRLGARSPIASPGPLARRRVGSLDGGDELLLPSFQAPLLEEETFQRALRLFQSEVAAMLRSVEEMAGSVVRDEKDDSSAREVRQRLQSSLYSVKAAHYIATGTGAMLNQIVNAGWARRVSRAASPSFAEPGATTEHAEDGLLGERAEPAGGSQAAQEAQQQQQQQPHQQERPLRFRWPGLPQVARRHLSQLVEERLSEAASEGSFADGGGPGLDVDGAGRQRGASTACSSHEVDSVGLEERFKQLREAVARSPSCADAPPHEDDRCRVELVIFFMKAVLLEIERAQLILLDY